MAKFNFNLRDPKSDKATPINLVIRWSNNRLVYPTLLTIQPKFWNAVDQCAIKTQKYPNHPEFNLKLADIVSKAEKSFLTFSTSPTIKEFKDLLDINLKRIEKEIEIKHTLFTFIEKFIEQSKTRVNEKSGKLLAKGTIFSSYQCLENLKEFSSTLKKPLDFDSIDLDFYYDFKAFLTKKGYKINTIGGKIKKLKWFLNAATEEGVNTKLSYRSKKFIASQVLTDTIYLNEKELSDLHKLDLTNNKRLERVRDLFLIGAWTGLRFSDFTTLSKAKFNDDYIEIITQKTHEPVVIPLHDVVKDIMSRYKESPYSLPRSLSNVKMNDYLKELGQMIDSLHETITLRTQLKGMEVIKDYHKFELLTTHTARRSFATNLYKDDFKVQAIMKITGHRTEAAFMRYIRVTPNENAKSLLMHWRKKTSLKIVG